MQKSILYWAFLGLATQAVFSESVQAASFKFGQTAVETIDYLSKNLAGRSVGTPQEAATVDYLVKQLKGFNYEPTLQPFTYEWRGETLTSYNILAERPGTSDKQMLLGAHYDTAPSSSVLDRSALEGTNDNASGVGVLLELAQRLEQETKHTVKFLFFGAEEIGLVGSEFYANSLDQQAIDNTLLMVNLDSLVVGDKLYFHAGRGAAEKPSWFRYRDLALEIAQDYGIEAYTNPGFNPEYPKGTGCCSDLESFDFLMPVLAAEATNWDIGDKDGYIQTTNPKVPGGATWHDPATDNRKFINEVFPGLIEERTYHYTLVLDTLIDRVNAQSVPEPFGLLGLMTTVATTAFYLKRHPLRN